MSVPTIRFPDTVTNLSNVQRRMYPSLYSYTPGTEHATDIERAFDGSEQTRARFEEEGFGLWQYTTFRLDPREAYQIRSFVRSLRGRAERFWFYTPDELWSDSKVIGMTFGTTVDLNVREISGFFTLKLDGVEYTDPFTINVNSGTYGQDQLVFDSAPTSGQVITMENFFAREVHVVRMDSDKEIPLVNAGGEDATLSDNYPNPRLFYRFQFVIRGARGDA